MKKIVLLSLTLLLTIPLSGQFKVCEKSSRKAPAWLNAVVKDYIIVSATAATLDEAKNATLAEVKKQISESIATRIVAETDYSRLDIEVNNKSSYEQALATSVKTHTAKLPFIGEITLSKAEDFYWEKRNYKIPKRVEYYYSIKYPFSEFDMKKLVMDFKIYDAELDEKIVTFDNGVSKVTSIEDIDNALIELRAFINEFLPDDPRYNKVESIANKYRKNYDYITISGHQVKKGVVEVTLSFAGNPMITQQKPLIKSNCAAQIKSSYDSGKLTITYEDFGCYDVDENYIEIRYKFGNKYVSEKVYIKLK